ncbi:TIGR03619 family F420-dependent LLM class oxidoreductase [Actinoplanes sp. NPDC051475]|uniref:TIGR03619 family F420-dependent LLM class oxidoreductase n=1 Tax=Actinoplanes sp. NPDC051475 TaxID=3157225 RepID=UPI00344CBC4E
MTRFGVAVPNFGPDVSTDWIRQWAARAEKSGFDLVALSDHIPTTTDVHDKYVAPFYEPFTTLSFVAAETRRIDVATSAIVLPHRHPLVVARMAVNLDAFSGGRFILGLAPGWSEQEYAALGLDFARRGPLMDDALGAMHQLWQAREDFTDYEGPYFTYRGVSTAPRPERPIPLWIGANHRAAVRRCVQWRAAWHPAIWNLDWFEHTALPELEKAAERYGGPVPEVCAKLKVFLTDAEIDPDQRRPGEGRLDQVVADVERLAGLNVHTILLDTDDARVRYAPRGLDDHWRVLDGLLAEAPSVTEAARRALS